MENQIDNYFENPSFEEGFMLLKKFGATSHTKQIEFVEKEGEQSTAGKIVLDSSLKHLRAKGFAFVKPLKSDKDTGQKTDPKPSVEYPARLKELIIERADAFTKMKNPDLTSDERKVFAERVTALTEERAAIFAEFDKNIDNESDKTELVKKISLINLPENYSLEELRSRIYQVTQNLNRQSDRLETKKKEEAKPREIKSIKNRIENWELVLKSLKELENNMLQNVAKETNTAPPDQT